MVSPSPAADCDRRPWQGLIETWATPWPRPLPPLPNGGRPSGQSGARRPRSRPPAPAATRGRRGATPAGSRTGSRWRCGSGRCSRRRRSGGTWTCCRRTTRSRSRWVHGILYLLSVFGRCGWLYSEDVVGKIYFSVIALAREREYYPVLIRSDGPGERGRGVRVGRGQVLEPKTKVDLTRYTEEHDFFFDEVLGEECSNQQVRPARGCAHGPVGLRGMCALHSPCARNS